MNRMKPGEWNLNDVNGFIDDSYLWPTIDTMTKQEMVDACMRLREKAVKGKDVNSIFYSMTNAEMIKKIDLIIKKRKIDNPKE